MEKKCVGLFPYGRKEEKVLETIRFLDHTMDATAFVHGICGIFALALNNKFGYPIYYIETTEEDDGYEYEQLVHIFCMKDNMYIDIRGMTTEEDSFFVEFNDFLDSGSRILDTSQEECLLFVKESMSEEEYDIFLRAAESIIDEHMDWYY